MVDGVYSLPEQAHVVYPVTLQSYRAVIGEDVWGLALISVRFDLRLDLYDLSPSFGLWSPAIQHGSLHSQRFD